MKRILFGGVELELRPAGTLYWPREKMLVASDLHLEKGSSFSVRGFFLPPYDTHDTLLRLSREIAERRPEHLILLGDSFHDERGFHRLNERDRRMFEDIVGAQSTVWISGNHDGAFIPAGARGYIDFLHGPLMFRHEAEEGEAYEISGHYHPAASIIHKGHKVGGRCFAVSKTRVIMPSFGSYTGGLDVFDPAVARFLGKEFEVHICLKERIYALKSSHFEK